MGFSAYTTEQAMQRYRRGIISQEQCLRLILNDHRNLVNDSMDRGEINIRSERGQRNYAKIINTVGIAEDLLGIDHVSDGGYSISYPGMTGACKTVHVVVGNFNTREITHRTVANNVSEIDAAIEEMEYQVGGKYGQFLVYDGRYTVRTCLDDFSGFFQRIMEYKGIA